MEDEATIGLREILKAACALFLSAILAIPTGVLTGLCTGIWFFIVGGYFGAIAGIPAGFLAALFGGAIGRRWGWTLSGGLVGGFIMFSMLELMLGKLGPASFHQIMSFCLFSVIGAFTGAISGWITGAQLENPYTAPKLLVGLMDHLLYESPLYKLSLRLRLAIACAESVPLLVFLGFCAWNIVKMQQ